jgi:phosphoglucosamine mutase
MTRKYFGTDGIRGKANTGAMTAEVAMRVGMAAGIHFTKDSHRHQVVIAKDTRLSGYMIEPALTAGFISVGMDVFLVGPMPTPAVAMLCSSLRADLGVMISASHNPFFDNGIKLFGPDGFKLSDDVEKQIEKLIDSDLGEKLVAPDKLGRAKRLDDAPGRYIEFVKRTFPKGMRLDGLRIVIDCANGASYHIAPKVFWELGAEIIPIGTQPDGFNINKDCGSTHPESIAISVIQNKADLGIALDGDADRLVMCDEKGQIIDGDQLIAMVATHQFKSGMMKSNTVVGTVMSNLGLERYFRAMGLDFVRTKVGDRYVFEKMQELGANIGGEQSGHIILSDYSTTGDGMIAALQVLALLKESGKQLSSLSRMFNPLPQVIENVRYKNGATLDDKDIDQLVETASEGFKGKGRLVVRKSGTESVVRVMAEGEELGQVKKVVEGVVESLQRMIK